MAANVAFMYCCRRQAAAINNVQNNLFQTLDQTALPHSPHACLILYYLWGFCWNAFEKIASPYGSVQHWKLTVKNLLGVMEFYFSTCSGFHFIVYFLLSFWKYSQVVENVILKAKRNHLVPATRWPTGAMWNIYVLLLIHLFMTAIFLN